jgi:precorrin-2 dehydrogenase/sirohydrochlorin ferrochelatase
MKYYPVFLNVADRSCLVVGGGDVAARKAETLVDAGARVTVVSPRVIEEILSWASDGRIELLQRPYRPDDLAGRTLAYAATDDDALHERIAADARSAGVLLNVVDRTQWCDFIVPSIARRGDLTVAVSTSGQSPALARRVRLDIEALLTPEYEEAIAIFSRLRRVLSERGWPYERRRELFENLLDADFLGSLRCSDRARADRLLAEHTGEAISTASIREL